MSRIIFLLVSLCSFTISCGQSLFSNDINSTNPNNYNPYTIGQIVHPDIKVSGINRGSGITGINANNRYDAVNWNTTTIDPTAYFGFTIMPNEGKKINFLSLKYSSQVSENGPTQFALRSSADNFTSNIGLISEKGATVSLADSSFQNSTSPITFRIYGWGANLGVGAFSINDFDFSGTVDCADPEPVVLPNVSIACTDTSFSVNWTATQNATGYTIDLATDFDFKDYVPSYNKKNLGNVTTTTIQDLIAGRAYYIRLHAANDCGNNVVSNIVMISPPLTTYNGKQWSNGEPNASKNILFLDNYLITTDLSACSCRINSGVSVNVAGVSILKLENGLDVIGTGILIFENNASLVQVNDAAVNTGNIVYKRISMPMNNFDFTYWGSPVSGQKLFDLSPNTFYDKYWKFEDDKWVASINGTDIMTPGRGYAIRVPKPHITSYPNGEIVPSTPYAKPVEFRGTPNNGVISLPLQPVGPYNLIGNPYPSALDADLFWEQNNTNLQGTFYFWTHYTPIANNSYAGTSDYASYNKTGGATGVADGAVPTGTIAAGQAFFMISTGSGHAVFNNSMRVTDADSNGQFFRGTKSKTVVADKSRVWLDLTNTDGLFKQMLLGYIEGATNGVDSGYDGESFDGNKPIDFYSVNQAQNFTIQGRSIPFLTTDEVPLGFKTAVDGMFTISLRKADGVLKSRSIFIEDKVIKKIHNLTNGSYSFTTLKGTFNDRFVLVYVDKTAVIPPEVGTDTTLESLDFSIKDKSVVVSVINHKIKINSYEQAISKVMVYDLRGRLLYEKNNINTNEYMIKDLKSSEQFLIVVTQFLNGKWVSKEIVL